MTQGEMFSDLALEQQYDNMIKALDMKQETLEEVAHEMLVDYGIKSIGQSIGVSTVKKLMVDMAKWQAERRYSEEEVRTIAKDAYSMGRNNILIGVFNKWFEQFKKK